LTSEEIKTYEIYSSSGYLEKISVSGDSVVIKEKELTENYITILKKEKIYRREKLTQSFKDVLKLGDTLISVKHNNTIKINDKEKILPDKILYTYDSTTQLLLDPFNNLYFMIENRIYLFNDAREFLLSFNVSIGRKFCVDRNVFFMLSEDQKLHRVTIVPELILNKPANGKFFSFNDSELHK